MKKNKMGFFLAETIVMIALVTTVMAFVYPNVSKLYDNYKNRVDSYDQTEDLYALRALYEAKKSDIDNKTLGKSEGCEEDTIGGNKLDANSQINPQSIYSINLNQNDKKVGIEELYIVNYMSTPSSNNYNFNKYLKRLRKITYDSASYRLIGVFEVNGKKRYASIKIENPNPSRDCNLGG